MFRKLFIVIIILSLSAYAFAGSQQTSSTLASDIITNARAHLNDDGSDSFHNDTDLLQWLNDGTVDLVSRSHCLEATEDINLVASQVEYTITSNYIVIKAVHYIDASSATKALVRSAPESVGLRRNTPPPAWWYDWANKIGVYPVLSSVTSEKVKVYLIPRPAAITSPDNITTPAIYDKALTMYIVAQAWAKDRQMAKHNQAMASYQAELDRYRKDFLSMPKEPAR